MPRNEMPRNEMPRNEMPRNEMKYITHLDQVSHSARAPNGYDQSSANARPTCYKALDPASPRRLQVPPSPACMQ
eukprot:32133-Chlamydomonas_euryale.AAC.1